MTIAQRHNSYLATVHHKGRRWRKQFQDRQEALKWEAQAKALVLDGGNPDSLSLLVIPSQKLPKNFGEIIEYTSIHEWADKKSGAGLRRNAELVAEIIGLDTDMGSIDNHMIDRLILRLKELGNSNGTINRKIASLSKCFTTALRLGVIDRKPQVKRLKEAHHRIRWFTDAEMDAMLAFLDERGNQGMKHWVRWQADTGLRCGETRGLTWQDVTGGAVHLEETKGGHPRSVPLTVAATKSIEYFSNLSHPFGWATKHYIRTWWEAIRTHMGWEDDKQAVPHALRHTFCSRLVQKGVPILTVKELAGHRTMDMTLRYAHLSANNLSSAIEVLEPLQT